jgi:[pyruvate, water dikinase]-phosphate phosphotransferase / [pyruvate, water dikinase] kinase
MTRAIFYVSDSTAMTAKGLGKSLLSQFENLLITEYLRPYVDSEEKILELIAEINTIKVAFRRPPIIFASMMDDSLMHTLSSKIDGVIDIFQPFVKTLERMIEEKPSKAVGRAHQTGNIDAYKKRIEAIDFTLATDDGLRVHDYHNADIILLGVSRSGKTPTALYLALNFGLKVANYPFTPDDLPRFTLREAHLQNRRKLLGLMISHERLENIRKERFAVGSYADPGVISRELAALKDLYEREKIPYVDTSTRSVEEIAASVVRLFSRIA